MVVTNLPRPMAIQIMRQDGTNFVASLKACEPWFRSVEYGFPWMSHSPAWVNHGLTVCELERSTVNARFIAG